MTLRLRPRFGLRVNLPLDDVIRRFETLSVDESHSCEVYLLDRQVEMTVDPEERHYWSPYLKMLLEREDSQTVLRGKFGPNINVWSLFVAVYAVIAMIGAGGLILAPVQVQLDQTPSGLWMSVGCLVLAVLVWIVGKIGQRWAYDQMVYIHRIVCESFADTIVDDPQLEQTADYIAGKFG